MNLRAVVSLFLSRQFGVYLLSGGVAALANFGAGEAVRHVSQSSAVYGASVVAGQVVGTIVAFFLHRRFTFAVHDQAAAPQVARFAVVAVGGLVLSMVLAELFLMAWQLAGSPWTSRGAIESLIHVAVIGINTIYGFIASKFFALRDRRLGTEGAAR